MACETRKGYAFNNPDTEANDCWGAIITADEMRYKYAFGNDLVAPNGSTITDDTLNDYVVNAIGHIETDLNVTLIKRSLYHRPPNVNGTIIPRSELKSEEAGIDFEWDEAYEFDRKMFNEFIFIKLRRRPVIEVSKVEFRDPTGNLITDMTSWMRVNYQKGSLEFFPHSGALFTFPLYTGSPYYMSPMRFIYDRYPDAFYVDYTAGFESAAHLKKKWPELFSIIGKVAAINLLGDFGDGKSTAIASSSLGLESISESFATTQSATNALFGARILQYKNDIKEFWKHNKHKYSGLLLASL